MKERAFLWNINNFLLSKFIVCTFVYVNTKNVSIKSLAMKNGQVSADGRASKREK
jgi:hypothetical protein